MTTSTQATTTPATTARPTATRTSGGTDRDRVVPPPPDGAHRTPRRLGTVDWIVVAGGAVCATGGLAVIAAWHLDAMWLLRPDTSSTPTAYNTGVCFVAAGLGLIAVPFRRRRVVIAAAVLVVSVAFLTLIENVLGRGLGIDQLLFRASVAGPGGVPGRLAPNTSIGFLIVGAVLAAQVRRSVRRPAVVTVLGGGLLLVLSGVAVVGYAVDSDGGYHWFGSTAMALRSAWLFGVLGASFLVLALVVPRRPGVAAGRAAPAAERWPARRIISLLAVATLLPMALLAYLSIVVSSRAVTDESRERVEESAVLEARALLARMGGLEGLVRSTSQRPLLIGALSDDPAQVDVVEISRHLEDLASLEPGIVSLAVTDPSGKLLAVSPHSPDIIGMDFSFRDWYQNVSLTGEVYVSEAIVGAAQGHSLVVAVAAPIVARTDAAVVGYLSVGYSLDAIQGLIQSFNVGGEVSLTVTDQAGVVLASPDQPDGLVSIASDEAVRRALIGEAGVLDTDGPDGRQLVGYAPVDELGWTVHAEVPTSVAFARVETLRLAVMTAAFVLGIGLVVGLVLVARVLNARAADDRERRRLAVELARSNAELEQFAYVASHDLSEPLRAISGPIALVARRYRDQLDPEAHEYIDFAVDGCNRMQSLIDGLLAYSRVGRLEDTAGPVDCNSVMRGVSKALAATIEESGATIDVGPLPTVVAEHDQIGQVFQNLVANALKFTRPGVAPTVSVSAAPDAQGSWRFTVTDNGIGIAPEHRDRIFGMFKRLHSRAEYPGTGIGLALSKKIVERHGGSIGVDDAPSGSGTTFWFTIPGADAANRSSPGEGFGSP